MIRKIITILCISFLAFSHSVLNASAFETNPTRIYAKEELENGYYLETVITTNYTQARSSIRNGTKTATYRDINGKALWSITVNGKSATCTSSTYSKANYSTSWKLSNAKASKNGAAASASITAKQYHQNGSLQKTINKTVKLTCSPNGSLS
ncbi:hypothetical protein EAI80_10310 [Catenibacterium sp. co_0103]|uniref:hypothetical protein n=1 Tax=unclassified Catenibacterium TaxID=2643636 RepID=UPI001021FAE6|nr:MULTISPECIES: hypothetical protein [unclassified Catenibacterium]MZT13048.1 hypothetical protein [Catenibacterium sp. BIOML-A1]RYT42703.1 hypothetical protein EAI80_10310 [Catenibacterium sp. co_0103]